MNKSDYKKIMATISLLNLKENLELMKLTKKQFHSIKQIINSIQDIFGLNLNDPNLMNWMSRSDNEQENWEYYDRGEEKEIIKKYCIDNNIDYNDGVLSFEVIDACFNKK
jgi:hypothetical protein